MLQTESTNGNLVHANDPETQEKNKRRHMGIKETDSDYVKLAKQGGHRGLLWHEESSLNVKTNSQYKPPDWFCSVPDTMSHISPTRPVPDFMSYEEFQRSERRALRPVDPPFGSDCKSAWEREADDFTAGEEKLSSKVTQNMGRLSPISEANKFKKVSSQKRATPVCMATLLRFGYVNDQENPPQREPHKASEASQLTSSDSNKMED